MQATDADSGINSSIEFSITSGNSDGLFYNYNSGGLVLMAPLDYETRTSHRLIVRAVDCPGGAVCGGSGRLSALVAVEVLVRDVNEFSPEFPVSHYYESVPESASTYNTIFQVSDARQPRDHT